MVGAQHGGLILPQSLQSPTMFKQGSLSLAESWTKDPSKLPPFLQEFKLCEEWPKDEKRWELIYVASSPWRKLILPPGVIQATTFTSVLSFLKLGALRLLLIFWTLLQPSNIFHFCLMITYSFLLKPGAVFFQVKDLDLYLASGGWSAYLSLLKRAGNSVLKLLCSYQSRHGRQHFTLWILLLNQYAGEKGD